LTELRGIIERKLQGWVASDDKFEFVPQPDG
jgi:hypothetical protein